MNLLSSTSICEQLANNAKNLSKRHSIKPHLAVVQVGNCPASSLFINKKHHAAKSLDFGFSLYHLAENTTEKEVIKLLHELNQDPEKTGIIVQLPLPSHLNAWKITNNIAYHKDVDCLSAQRMGEFLTQECTIMPGTAAAISLLCNHYSIDVSGLRATVVGASNLVGKPAAIWLTRHGATVTLCHALSQNIANHVAESEIIVSATGKGDIIPPEAIHDQHIIFDIGIRKENNVTMGDIDSPHTRKIAKMITPVPGGIGPLTVAILIYNLAYLTANPTSEDELG